MARDLSKTVINERGVDAVRGTSVGSLRSNRHSVEATQQIIGEQLSGVGPEVMQAASQIINTWKERAGIFDEDEPENDDVDVAAEEERIFEYAIQNALIVRPEAGGAVTTPADNVRFHKLLNVARGRVARNQMGMMVSAVFGGFPCYTEKGRNPNSVDCLMQVGNPQVSNGGRQLVAQQQQMNHMARTLGGPSEDFERVSHWIKNQGIVVGASKLDFSKMLPGYKPNIVVAMSEDKTYLLCEENAGVASYTFDSQSKRFSIKVREGCSVDPGTTLVALDLNAQKMKQLGINTDEVNIDMFDCMNLGCSIYDGKLNIFYNGVKPLGQGGSVSGALVEVQSVKGSGGQTVSLPKSDTPFLKYVASDIFAPQGACTGHRGGDCVVDMRTIYSWPGGQALYRDRPDLLRKLLTKMEASSAVFEGVLDNGVSSNIQHRLSADFEPPKVREIAAPVEESSASDPVVEKEKAKRVYVTQPVAIKKPAVVHKKKRFNAVFTATQNGFHTTNVLHNGEIKPLPIKKCEDGYIALIPLGGKSLPMATEFEIAVTKDVSNDSFVGVAQVAPGYDDAQTFADKIEEAASDINRLNLGRKF